MWYLWCVLSKNLAVFIIFCIQTLPAPDVKVCWCQTGEMHGGLCDSTPEYSSHIYSTYLLHIYVCFRRSFNYTQTVQVKVLLFQPLCLIFVCISELAWFRVVSVTERNKSGRLVHGRSSRDETGFLLLHTKENGIWRRLGEMLWGHEITARVFEISAEEPVVFIKEVTA